MSKTELQLKLDRARWFVLQNSPFYGSLAMALADVIGNPHGKTACTDGKRIFWDNAFLEKLTDEELRFVLIHETLHCAHGHLWRFPANGADHKTANEACDHAINLTLQNSDLRIAMPAGGLADRQFDGQAEEEIYAALSQKPESQDGPGKPQDRPDNGAGGPGDGPPSAKPGKGKGKPQDGPPGDVCGDYCAPADDASQDGPESAGNGDKAGPGNLRDKWAQNVIQAAQAAKASGQGNVPGDMARELAKLAAVQIDWRAETADFIKNSAGARNDWTRGARRHLWQSVIYPSRRADNCGKIIGVRDTSGSIDDKTAAEFSAILGAACAELNCELILIDCDTDIAAEYHIAPGDEIPLKACGGGGTDFAAPFKRAAELIESGEKIAGLIYLTDLQGDNWPADEIVPALCICTENKTAPSGRTVQLMN